MTGAARAIRPVGIAENGRFLPGAEVADDVVIGTRPGTEPQTPRVDAGAALRVIGRGGWNAVGRLLRADAAARFEFGQHGDRTLRRLADDGERLIHAHLKINGASVMLNDEFPEYTGLQDVRPAGVTLHLQVADPDAWWTRALVVGGGVAGMSAALNLADQGFEVILVEKEKSLGGMAARLTETIEGADIAQYLEDLIGQVSSHPDIQVLRQSLIVGFTGFKGNFTTEVLVGPGMYERKIDHGVVVLSTGATEYVPNEFLYGQDPRVMTQVELANRLNENGAEGLDQVVMIQCVGSRNEQNPNCSRICCQSAVKNALHIKKMRPEAEVYVLYRDIRTYGFMEDYYTEARRQGIFFFRYEADDPPTVAASEDGITVSFKDHVLGRRIEVPADLLALSAGMVPQDTEELASILKLARTPEGFLMEAHVKLRPVDMATEGIFVCGTAHSPMLMSESIAQAVAAASRAATFLSQPHLTLSAVTATVEQDRCAACLICVRSCPYGVPRINEDGVSEIDVALCHGCGVCASECPAKAIELNWYEDDQMISKIDALLEGAM